LKGFSGLTLSAIDPRVLETLMIEAFWVDLLSRCQGRWWSEREKRKDGEMGSSSGHLDDIEKDHSPESW